MTEPPRVSKRWRWPKLVLGLAVSLTFLWLLLKGIDPEGLRSSFVRLSVPHLLLALGFLASGYAVRVVRWWWMLRAFEPELKVSACFGPLLASVAVNNVLPFRAGDVLRIFGFRRQLRSPAVRIFGTLVIERLLDLQVLLAFFFAGLILLRGGDFSPGFVTFAVAAGGMALVTTVALVLFSPRISGLVGWIASRPSMSRRGWGDGLDRSGRQLGEALVLVRSPKRAAALVLLSLLAWTLEGAVFVTVAHTLASGASPAGPWFALATGTLATLLPSTPGYVGTFDFFAMQGLAAHGAGQEVSAAFALTVHAVLWVPITVAGLAFLLPRGRGLPSAWRPAPRERDKGVVLDG